MPLVVTTLFSNKKAIIKLLTNEVPFNSRRSLDHSEIKKNHFPGSKSKKIVTR